MVPQASGHSSQLVVLGLMSGTSADGIDGALLRISAMPTLAEVRDAFHHHVPFTPAQRAAIFSLFDTTRATAEDVCHRNFLIGEWFATAALRTIEAAGVRPADVDLIGSHGQTIFHCPPTGRHKETACTLQLGEPAVIAERTGVTTVADFRVRDVAAGGHGAPLVSYVDSLLFREKRTTRVILNLGGIGNVTVLWPEADPRPPLAFDTGPANMVLDWLATRLTDGALSYDAGGRLAAAGTADEALLTKLLSDPYFAAPPPKTTGREQFGGAYAARLLERAQQRGLSPEDAMATALALTVRTVAGAIRTTALGPTKDEGRKLAGAGPSFVWSLPLSGAKDPPSIEVIAGGGGTQNPTLMAGLRQELPEAQVLTHEDLGVSSKAKEALSFAILAARAIRGEPNTVPSCTGARQAVVMGKILPGANYAALMRRLFSDAANRP